MESGKLFRFFIAPPLGEGVRKDRRGVYIIENGKFYIIENGKWKIVSFFIPSPKIRRAQGAVKQKQESV